MMVYSTLAINQVMCLILYLAILMILTHAITSGKGLIFYGSIVVQIKTVLERND